MAMLGAMPFAVQPFFLGVMTETLMLAPDQVGLMASADILGVVLASFSGFGGQNVFRSVVSSDLRH